MLVVNVGVVDVVELVGVMGLDVVGELVDVVELVGVMS